LVLQHGERGQAVLIGAIHELPLRGAPG